MSIMISVPILFLVDIPLGECRGIRPFVPLALLDQLPDETPLVVLVENREIGSESGFPGMTAEDPVGHAVEGSEPHRLGTGTDQLKDSGTHFTSGLVRERDREDRLWRNASGLDAPRDPLDQDSGLPASGTGQDEYRTRREGHGLTLFGVEGREEWVRAHARYCTESPEGSLAPGRGPEGVCLHLDPAMPAGDRVRMMPLPWKEGCR